MPAALPPRFRGHEAERTIAATRAVLAGSSLFAIWLDPSEPAGFAALTNALHTAYAAYALVLGAFVWRRTPGARLALATHVADIFIFSIFQYLTLGPSSPFFVYFVFSMFCGAVRWGWRGALGTAPVVLVAYASTGVWMSVAVGSVSELNRFIIRLVYLAMVAWLLVYLGRHEARLRDDIERLARWPGVTAGDAGATTARLLEHAAGILGASTAVLVWETVDEPWMYVSVWSGSECATSRHPPTELSPPVSAEYQHDAFVSENDHSMVHPGLRAHLAAGTLASAALGADRLSGRAFFSGLHEATPGTVSLLEVVVRELGGSMNELLAHTQLRQLAMREERIAVARDLHDGVLQALTGVRFELRDIAQESSVAAGVRERLAALERALAMEQRELRLFIDDLKPLSGPREQPAGVLATRIEELRARLAAEWKQPITVRIASIDRDVPPAIDGAVPFIVHEAIVNALKHARPSKVAVDVAVVHDRLAIVVSDDGRGFPFHGRLDGEALRARNVGPVSLRERVGALGGRLTVDSAPSGSRVEIELPLAQEEPAWRSA